MNKSTKVIVIAAALSLLSSFQANSADKSEYQTKEYYGSGGLDIINAAEAYSKGYTGKGITIGINDQPANFEHMSFSDKTGSKYIGSLSINEADWENLKHGTHVGAIAAGSKNNSIMHGVSFDADLLSSYGFSEDSDFSKYISYPNVKIINNSWGSNCNFDNILKEKTDIDNFEDLSSDEVFDNIVTFMNEQGGDMDLDSYLDPIVEAMDEDKLLVFSAGNEGQTLSNLSTYAPYFKYGVEKNQINVTAVFNSTKENSHLTRNSDGSINGDYINSFFSNLAKYCEDYSIAAPGWDILSADSSNSSNFINEDGTSMAAPFVTGSAALVQQAFPYMTSKQIGDVILSTANNQINLEHQYAVTFKDDSDDDEDEQLKFRLKNIDEGIGGANQYSVSVFYFDDRTRSNEEIIDDIAAFSQSIVYDTCEAAQNQGSMFDDLAAEGKINVFYQVPLQEFIGQGILDVGKAVNGPGALNARRLSAENLSYKYETDARATILYDVDTKGYDSVWSNDIKEIRVGKLANDSIEEDLRERYNYYDVNWLSNEDAEPWAKAVTKAFVEKYNQKVDENGLEGLHVGLLKKGAGNLRLEGNNTYKGASVAIEGTLTINGSVAGDAYSDEYGTIAGKGTINGKLYNNNIAIAGDEGLGNLTMGALESKGTLTAVVNNEGNTKFIVKGAANVDGSTIKVQGLVPGESYTVLSANSINGKLSNNKENSTPVTTFMSEYAKIENNEIKVVSEFSDEPNVVDIPAGSANNVTFTERQKKAFKAIKNMYFKLMSELPDGVASYRRSFRAATTPQQVNQIMTMINLPAAQAAPALSAVINNAAAQSMTLVQRNSMTGDILSSHFADRFSKASTGGEVARSAGGVTESVVNSDSKEQPSSQANSKNTPFIKGGCPQSGLGDFQESNNEKPLCKLSLTSPLKKGSMDCHADKSARNDDNGAWFKFVYNKGEMRDGARYHGRSGIIGYDLKLTDTKSYGLFFGHGNNTIDGFDDAWAKNKIEENKFGIYASKKNNKASGFLYLDYGKVDNELNRNLTNLDLSTKVKYKGNLFEIGSEYKLTPKSQQNKSWKVYPYVNLQFSRYKQDGYHENGGGIFNQVVESKTNNYTAGQLGLEFNFSNEKENYVLRLAGKTAFSGYEPKLTFSFEGDMANRYELDNEQDKNHLLVSFKGERKISADTLLSADFSMQRGSHDRDMKASLYFWRKF